MTDAIAAHELVLSADNESSLYPQKKAIIANLCRHVARGQYDRDKAVTAWMHFAESAARWYSRMYANGAWTLDFPPATRRAAAEEWARAFEAEYDCNQWDGINPVKPEKRPARCSG